MIIPMVLLMSSIATPLLDEQYDEYTNTSISVFNESLSMAPENSTELSTVETSESLSTNSTTTQSSFSTESLVDQMNSYRNAEILSRIDQCDSSMKLNDICEMYSIDNYTNLLVHQPLIRFQTLENIYDSLINRTMVENLTNSCPIAQWCLGNLSRDDVEFASNMIRRRGDSFCTLQHCHFRLVTYIHSCPSLAKPNISIPTLNLLPMLCSLYTVQEKWTSTRCVEDFSYFFHIFFAFWPQFERCYDDTLIDSDTCAAECRTFDDILENLEYQCSDDRSFFSQIPALSSYRSAKLKRICRGKNLSQRFPFIHSVEEIFSFDLLWRQSQAKPLYLIFFLIIVVCFFCSCSLCLHSKLKHKHRRFDDSYVYTRIHNSVFELGQNTEISDTNLAINDAVDDETQFDINASCLVSPEHERLLQIQL
ncbi:unnamed protein product [Adineta ricciae]|uniref:Uncharacterized protein n=1 Tax=Adineta ricciae TaxID=249248 RepID=A0A815GA19_ADIRI|nr:unnamed protein product [Adineta ricciae]CAF1403606.1 unnamed protein product [Adineta ricciae]